MTPPTPGHPAPSNHAHGTPTSGQLPPPPRPAAGARESWAQARAALLGTWSTWCAEHTSRRAAAREQPRAALSDLFLPRTCAGCGRGGSRLCADCQRLLRTPPGRVYPRLQSLVPIFALGDYAGPRRQLILNTKERGRHDTYPALGAVLAAAITYLAARGELPEPEEILLMPAPTRRAHARARGGDPVAAICAASGLATHASLHFTNAARDSVGLSLAARQENAHAHLIIENLPPRDGRRILLVDDIVTTGATLQAASYALHARGMDLCGAIAFCAA